MPVSIVRRYALQAFVGVAVVAVVVAIVTVGPLVVGAVRPSVAPNLPTRAGIRPRTDVTRVDLVAGSSVARYRSLEVLSGRGVNEAVGTTSDVAGTLLLQHDGTALTEQSRITVDLRTLQSDSTMRDSYIKRNTLETALFPTAEFVVTEAPGLPVPLPSSGTVTFELVGELTVHGVTRPTTWQAMAEFVDGEISGTATTTVLMTDFGMTPPRVGSVVSIEDAVRLELDVRGTVAPSLADLLSDPT